MRTFSILFVAVMLTSCAAVDEAREDGGDDTKADGIDVSVPVFAITNNASGIGDFMSTDREVLRSTQVQGAGLHGIAYGENRFVTVGSEGEVGGQIGFLNDRGEISRPSILTDHVVENSFFGDGVFLATKWGGTVVLLDGDGNVIHPGVSLGLRPIGAAFGEGVWFVVDFDGTVGIIDNEGNIIARDIRVGTG